MQSTVYLEILNDLPVAPQSAGRCVAIGSQNFLGLGGEVYSLPIKNCRARGASVTAQILQDLLIQLGGDGVLGHLIGGN